MIVFIFITVLLIILILNEYSDLKMNIKDILYLETQVELKEKINEDYNAIYGMIQENGGIKTVEQQIETNNNILNDNSTLIAYLYNDIRRLNEENTLLEQKLEQLKQETKSFMIDNVITYDQFPDYPTGCESVALYILLKYYNIDIAVEDIVENLKKGILPYTVGSKEYGGNPEVEFIGDPRTDYSYGTYNGPIAYVANKFKSNVISRDTMEFAEVLDVVRQNRPAIVWTTINLVEPTITSSWIYKPTGEVINWIDNEHVVVIIGFNNDSVIVSDPYTGTIRYFDKQLFKRRYDYLGKRAIYY